MYQQPPSPPPGPRTPARAPRSRASRIQTLGNCVSTAAVGPRTPRCTPHECLLRPWHQRDARARRAHTESRAGRRRQTSRLLVCAQRKRRACWFADSAGARVATPRAGAAVAAQCGGVCMCVCVCVCGRGEVRAREGASEFGCARSHARARAVLCLLARACVRACVRACMRACQCVFVLRVFVCVCVPGRCRPPCTDRP